MSTDKKSFFGWGGDSHPANEPQYLNDVDSLGAGDIRLFDQPGDEPGYGDFNFVFGNGQLEVSADHSHEELADHAGVDENLPGPLAVGKVEVSQGRAHWLVSGNLSLSNLAKKLKDYSKSVGWRWGGIASLDGMPISDDYMPKKAVYYTESGDGVAISYRPSPNSKGMIIQGSTLRVGLNTPDGVLEWARDSGLKVAEYPGGGNANDKIKNHAPMGEDLETFNNGSMHEELERPSPGREGPFIHNGQRYETYEEYLKGHAAMTQDIDSPVRGSGGFPELDMDKSVPPHFIDRKPYFDVTAATNKWVPGSFGKGAIMNDGTFFYWTVESSDGSPYHNEFLKSKGYTDEDLYNEDDDTFFDPFWISDKGDIEVLKGDEHLREVIKDKVGIKETSDKGSLWSFAAQSPKDMIKAPVPFIYDIDEDTISIGHEGDQTSDISGQFTPGGIVEGEYAPGGKVTISTSTNYPWTVRHFADLFYWQFPQMEISSVHFIDSDGKKTRLASSGWDIGEDLNTQSESDIIKPMRDMSIVNNVRAYVAASPSADRASKALEAAGGKVYAVGGVVRDSITGSIPNDVDLVVENLSGSKVESVLSKLEGKVSLTGKSFGVYRYRVAGDETEIALPRTEKSNGARRSAFEVSTDGVTINDDLARRDFTANAIAVHVASGDIVDPLGGVDDAASLTLKTTHDQSFFDDPTRILRGLYMVASKGFSPSDDMADLMASYSDRIALEAQERIGKEFLKIMASKDPAKAIRIAQDTGVLRYVVPELSSEFDFDQNNRNHAYTLGEHTLNVLANAQDATDDVDIRIAALFHDLGKPSSAWLNPKTGKSSFYLGPLGEGDDHDKVGERIARDRLKALHIPVAQIDRIAHLVRHHMFQDFSSEKGARKFLNRVGKDHAEDLMILREADRGGKGTEKKQASKTPVNTMRAYVDRVIKAGSPTNTAELPINGQDIMKEFGIAPGPKVGEYLKFATKAVITDPNLDDRDTLLAYLKKVNVNE